IARQARVAALRSIILLHNLQENAHAPSSSPSATTKRRKPPERGGLVVARHAARASGIGRQARLKQKGRASCLTHPSHPRFARPARSRPSRGLRATATARQCPRGETDAQERENTRFGNLAETLG